MKKEHVLATTISIGIIIIMFLLIPNVILNSIPFDIKIIAVAPIVIGTVLFSEWNFNSENSKPPLLI